MPRADILLVELGHAPSRSKAQALIKAGLVFVNGKPITKVSSEVAPEDSFELQGDNCPYVSRGGLKLAHALAHFNLVAQNIIGLDVGASTGGFTDVLLQSGAAKVYAVDVGHEQLAPRLRSDARVVSLEGLNARAISAREVPENVDAVVCDASFISLKLALPAALARAKEGAWCVALIKPQFEAGRAHVGKNGVVKDAGVHQALCADMSAWLESIGWPPLGVIESPIVGPQGNHEFLIAARKKAPVL